MDRAVAPEHGWLCPGWEECAAPWGECTLSRCCTDEGFACLLNKSSAAPRQWYAQCRPAADAEAQGWIAWTQSEMDSLWQSVKEPAATLSPGEIVAIVAASVLTALGALCACWRMRKTVQRLEAELATAREVSKRASWRLEASRKARGVRSNSEGASLMETGAGAGAGMDDLELPSRAPKPVLPDPQQKHDMDD